MNDGHLIIILGTLAIFGALLRAVWYLASLHCQTQDAITAIGVGQVRMAEVGQQTHALVNTAMRLTLAERVVLAHRNVALARRLAQLSGVPEDEAQVTQAEAELVSAETVYAAHMAREREADASETPK